MRFSLVTETFPPEINGVSMTLGRLVQGLRQRRFDVQVVAPARPDRIGTAPSLFPVPGFPIPRYPELRFGLPANSSLERLWRRQRPDCVHIATEGPLGWSAGRVARHLGIPVVSSFHTNFHSYGSHYGFGFLKNGVLAWLRAFHNATLRTFVPSADMIDLLTRRGFRNLRLFSRGVDTRLFHPDKRDPALRHDWGAGPQTPVILYVGRLAGEKNLSLTIRAFRAMRELLPDARMVLVGDGPERKPLQADVPEATFTGMLQGEALATAYASADAFLFASITETFGNVVTEAMASGLPVLAFNYAAPGRFIVPGKNGALAPLNDEPAFLDQARQLAAIRSRWTQMGLAARQTLLPHSWDRIIDHYIEDIQSLPSTSP